MPINTRNIANRRPALPVENPKGKKLPEFLLKNSRQTTDDNVNEESTLSLDVGTATENKKRDSSNAVLNNINDHVAKKTKKNVNVEEKQQNNLEAIPQHNVSHHKESTTMAVPIENQEDMLPASDMHQSSDSLSNSNSTEIQHQPLIPNQQADSPFIDKPIDFDLVGNRNEIPVEVEHIDAQLHKASINEHVEYQDNSKQKLPNESNDRNHQFQSALDNDQQQLKDNSLITDDIQDLQISDLDPTVPYGMENNRHYSTYFFQQTDFEDYTNSNMMPRAPKLFTGKRYVS